MKCKIAGEIYQVFDIVRSKNGKLWIKTLRIGNKDPFMKQFGYVPDENYMYYVPFSDVTEFIYEPLSKEDNKEQEQINIANDPSNGFCPTALKTSATLKAPIDWEQRRYEIAKAAMVGRLASPIIEGIDPNPGIQEVCVWSVKFADALINELKKHNNG